MRLGSEIRDPDKTYSGSETLEDLHFFNPRRFSLLLTCPVCLYWPSCV